MANQCYHSSSSNDAWIQYTFAREFDFTRVDLLNRGDSNRGERAVGTEIWVCKTCRYGECGDDGYYGDYADYGDYSDYGAYGDYYGDYSNYGDYGDYGEYGDIRHKGCHLCGTLEWPFNGVWETVHCHNGSLKGTYVSLEKTNNYLSVCEAHFYAFGLDLEDVHVDDTNFESPQWQCPGDLRCIPNKRVCDGQVDCRDGEDELQATCGYCSATEFQCLDMSCIPLDKRCDSVFDCVDGSDELDATCNISNHEQVFVCCGTPTTIPITQMCDTRVDCYGTGEDESELVCGKSLNLTCIGPEGALMDLTHAQMGDGILDCDDGIDELCSWKYRIQDWVHPLLTDEHRKYQAYVALLASEPDNARWYNTFPNQQMTILGHQLPNMILDCFFDNNLCSETAVNIGTSQMEKYGNCFSFEVTAPVSNTGEQYGLTLMINLETYQHIGLNTGETSIKLFITEAGKRDRHGAVFVDAESEVSFSPGQQHFIKLSPMSKEKLPAPYSDCVNYDRGERRGVHSRGHCEWDCLHRWAMQHCGCTDDASFLDGVLCSFEDTGARRCVNELRKGWRASSLCNCPVECNKKWHPLDVSSSRWPTSTSLPQFMQTLSSRNMSTQSEQFLLQVVDLFADDQRVNTKNALMTIRENYVKITVYFSDSQVTRMVERPVYSVVVVLSNFGGLLGLYLGCSALTFLELLDFLFDIYDYVAVLGKKKRLEDLAS